VPFSILGLPWNSSANPDMANDDGDESDLDLLSGDDAADLSLR
jgi:hypothetical protein